MILHLMLAFGLATARAGEPSVQIFAFTELFPRLNSTLERLKAGDLLVLDLDNTVFREAQSLGTDEWYTHQIAELTASGLSHRAATVEFEATNNAIKNLTQMRLMEDSWPEVIRALQTRGVYVLGLTARHPNLAPPTLRQLGRLGIHFTHSKFPARRLKDFRLPELHNAFAWRGGIAFSDGSPKGLVLRALIERSGVKPEFILAIDDRIHHVHSFAEMILEMGHSGQVIHYLKAQEEGPMDPRVTARQLEIFLVEGRIASDAETLEELTRQESCTLALNL